MVRKKKTIAELPDDKLPCPFTISFIDDPQNLRIRILKRPDRAEIIDEVKRRGLNDFKDGKFTKS